MAATRPPKKMTRRPRATDTYERASLAGASHGGGASLPFSNRSNIGLIFTHLVHRQSVLFVAWVTQDWCTATARVG